MMSVELKFDGLHRLKQPASTLRNCSVALQTKTELNGDSEVAMSPEGRIELRETDLDAETERQILDMISEGCPNADGY